MADTVSIQSEVEFETGRRRLKGILSVGGDDTDVIEFNRAATGQLQCRHELHNAGHLFAEPGALQAVARIAGDGFQAHLVGTGTRT